MRLMCMISFPLDASHSTGMKPDGVGTGVFAGSMTAGLVGGDAVAHEAKIRRRSERRFMTRIVRRIDGHNARVESVPPRRRGACHLRPLLAGRRHRQRLPRN